MFRPAHVSNCFPWIFRKHLPSLWARQKAMHKCKGPLHDWIDICNQFTPVIPSLRLHTSQDIGNTTETDKEETKQLNFNFSGTIIFLILIRLIETMTWLIFYSTYDCFYSNRFEIQWIYAQKFGIQNYACRCLSG